MQSRNLNPNLSFYGRAKAWIKENLLLTSAILGGLIVGGIFTGGLIFLPLLVPLAINVGMYCMAIGCGVMGACIVGRLTLTEDGTGLGAFGTILAGAAAAYGGAVLVAAAPILGIIAAGAAAVIAGGTVIGAFLGLLECCFPKMFSRAPEHRPTRNQNESLPSPSNQNEVRTQTYSRLPELAIATHGTPTPAITAVRASEEETPLPNQDHPSHLTIGLRPTQSD